MKDIYTDPGDSSKIYYAASAVKGENDPQKAGQLINFYFFQ